jgi:hypothetical protein
MTLYTTFDTEEHHIATPLAAFSPRTIAHTARAAAPRLPERTMRDRLAANDDQANLLATIYEIGGMAVIG